MDTWLVCSTPDGLGSNPDRGLCVVFLNKALHSHSASLHLGLKMRTGGFNAGVRRWTSTPPVIKGGVKIFISFGSSKSNSSIFFFLRTFNQFQRSYSVFAYVENNKTIYYSTFIHCTNSDFLFGWFEHVTLGYDATTSLTTLSWCNSRGVNSIHHCHYTMASADSKFDDFCLQCIQFE